MSRTESEHVCPVSSKYFVPLDDEEEFQSNCDQAGKSCLIVKFCQQTVPEDMQFSIEQFWLSRNHSRPKAFLKDR